MSPVYSYSGLFAIRDDGRGSPSRRLLGANHALVSLHHRSRNAITSVAEPVRARAYETV